MSNESEIIERVRKRAEYQKNWNKTHVKSVQQANIRYWKRARVISRLLIANPSMTFEEARTKAFEQIPTPKKSEAVGA